MRKRTAPRIGENSEKFYISHFSSLNAGMEYCAAAFPEIYRRAMNDMRGKFTRGELMLMIDSFNSTVLTPGLAGQHLFIHIADSIDLDALDKKWDIDPGVLLKKIGDIGLFEKACLEIWANGFWYPADPEEPLDIEAWVKQLL